MKTESSFLTREQFIAPCKDSNVSYSDEQLDYAEECEFCCEKCGKLVSDSDGQSEISTEEVNEYFLCEECYHEIDSQWQDIWFNLP